MAACMDKYLLLEDFGIVIPCSHDHVTSNSSKKVTVRLIFNICQNIVYYHRNGRRWVSKQNIPTDKGLRVNPFCPECRNKIARYLILENNLTNHVVNQKLDLLNDEVWNKVLIIVKERLLRGDNNNNNNNKKKKKEPVESHDHKVDGIRFTLDRVCNEEEFRAWIAKGNHAFEEEIPAIEGLERVSFDDEDDDDDEFLKRENVCGICLRRLRLKNMGIEDQHNNDEEAVDDATDTATDIDIKTMSLVKLPCQHVFHEPCVLRWLHRNHVCPFCRFKLPRSGPVRWVIE